MKYLLSLIVLTASFNLSAAEWDLPQFNAILQLDGGASAGEVVQVLGTYSDPSGTFAVSGVCVPAGLDTTQCDLIGIGQYLRFNVLPGFVGTVIRFDADGNEISSSTALPVVGD